MAGSGEGQHFLGVVDLHCACCPPGIPLCRGVKFQAAARMANGSQLPLPELCREALCYSTHLNQGAEH